MSEIALGIDVYYETKKNFKNVVFLPEGKIAYYPPGGMVFELVSDEAIALVVEKPESMIRIYPGYHDPLSAGTVTDGFRWLYGTVEDESLPIATELFRSSFNDAIQQTLQETVSLDEFSCVGAFLESCYSVHAQSIGVFAAYFDALAAHESGMTDEDQEALAQEFQEFAEEMSDVYTHKCSVRRVKGSRSVELLNISNYLEMLTFEFCQMQKKNKVVKICANCGRYFIPPKRKDSIYCLAPAPDDPTRTCQQVGPNRKQARKIHADPNEHEHQRVRSQINMMQKRARDRGEEHLVRTRCHNELEKEKKRYEAAKAEDDA